MSPTEDEMDYAAGHVLVRRLDFRGYHLVCWACGYVPSDPDEANQAKRFACLPDDSYREAEKEMSGG